jgi:hypothetical protein
VCVRCARGGRRSPLVHAAAGQRAEHIHGPLLGGEPEEDAPVADAEAILVLALQLDDVAARRIGDEAIQRFGDASAYRRIEAPQVAACGQGDFEAQPAVNRTRA